MVDEILSHVPPLSLVRFKTVCKRWNALFNDKKFINNHKLTFRFILTTQSKIYSVSIDPKIMVHELKLDIPWRESPITHLVDCDELFLCGKNKEATVWNPWFKQSRRINADYASQPSFGISGIGYDNNNNNNMRVTQRCYKTIGSYWNHYTVWKTQNFSSDEWKDPKLKTIYGERSRKDKPSTFFTRYGVSLHGNLYWIAFYDKTDLFYHLLNFNFSSERFYGFFCELPCGVNHPRDALVLRVFMGDQFSLLKQCYKTKKIEIWVTKNKINVEDGNDVVWMNFMSLSIPNFPGLVPSEYRYTQPSYFIDNNRLVLCFCDGIGYPCIYVVEENKLISKVQLNDVVDPWPLHCTYFPSLVPVPGGSREEALLQV
ncbi:hypothetical protein N665_0368s0012 [Sinapis alba]|nr:hypothetical protein N665_0368s0012 [Sinapis alba]